MKHNEAQRMWINIIHAVLSLKNFDLEVGDLKYVFSNMIAKYVSSKDYYYVSKGVKKLIDSNEDLSVLIYKEGPKDHGKLFYGKKSIASKLGSPTLFEHTVPMSIVRDQLLKARYRFQNAEFDEESLYKVVENIMSSSGEVVVILKEEDARLTKSKMPEEWKYGGDPFARYRAAIPAIEIVENFLIERNYRIYR